MHLWLGQAAWHDAQGEASRGCSYRRRILAEPHRLQPDPHPEIGCRIGELRKETRKSLLYRAKRLNHQHKAPYRNGKSSNFPVFPQTARSPRKPFRRDQARSKRSRSIILVHAATKSFTNFSFESAHA